jgi:uncharacterized protein YeaO (DUF488 family)/tellurite resistance protein TehA-like permease
VKIAIKRAYEEPAPGDGYRVLVDRVWPRGRSKDALALGEWARDLAPSARLRTWFCHDPAKFDAFTERYRDELAAPEQQARLRSLLAAAEGRTLTLVYGAKDESTIRQSCCATCSHGSRVAADVSAALRRAVRGFPPAYFALVMATGIVAVDARSAGLPGVASALGAFDIAAYAVICALFGLRARFFARETWRELTQPRTGPPFFASVAATAVVGSDLAPLDGGRAVALTLWVIALALWALLACTMATAFVVSARKRSLVDAVDGASLLAVVATQSLAVLAADLAPGLPHLLFAALGIWLAGIALYVGLIALVAYRLAFLPLSPAQFTPPYWITMGAMAISTLAGARIALAMPQSTLMPFIDGATRFCWAVASAWIPLLIALTLWRHAWARAPLRYEPLWWSAVFPLAMYAAGTSEMTRALRVEALYPVLPALYAVAIAAWALAFAGLVRVVLRGR